MTLTPDQIAALAEIAETWPIVDVPGPANPPVPCGSTQGRAPRTCESTAPSFTTIVEGMASEIVPGITADPAVGFGKPVIAGTRVPAVRVLELLAAGHSESEICSEYDLTQEQIQAVLRFAAWLAAAHNLRAS